MKKVLLLLFVFVQTTIASFAQGGLELHGGLAIPSGDLGDKNYLGAGTGLNLGLNYIKPLQSVENLNIQIGCNLFYNGVSKDVKDGYSSYLSSTMPKSIIIPVTGGVNYTYNLGNNLAILGEIGLGFDVAFRTKLEYSYYDEEQNYTENYSETCDPSASICLNIGTGFIINNKLSVKLNYWNLGNHKFKYSYSDEYPEYPDSNKSGSGTSDKYSHGMLTLTVGINLFRSGNSSSGVDHSSSHGGH
jgi:hypothetical protein